MWPWAHAHQRKAIWDFMRAIMNQQTFLCSPPGRKGQALQP
jgi:hypothetical protein